MFYDLLKGQDKVEHKAYDTIRYTYNHYLKGILQIETRVFHQVIRNSKEK